MMQQYGMNYGYMPQQTYGYGGQQQSYGVVAQSPNYAGGAMYGYNSPYGLYGQNPSMTLAESPYARLTNQTTQFSNSAIPNLSTFQQPMTVDMNAFMGNTTGIPIYPSFIGSTAMMNSDQPLYSSYQQYQNQNPQYQNYGYPQQNYGYQQQQMQQQAVSGYNNYNIYNNYVQQPIQQQQLFAQQPMIMQQPVQQQQLFAQQPMIMQQPVQQNNEENTLMSLVMLLLTTLLHGKAEKVTEDTTVIDQTNIVA